MLKEYDLFIFDFDGTLVDTSEGILSSVNYTREYFGLKPYTFEQARVFIGIGQTALIEGILQEKKTEIDLNQAIKIFRTHHEQNMLKQTRFYPGIKEGLKKLEKNQKKMVIVSNKYSFYIKKILEHLSCPVIFDLILGAENVPAKKPDPAPILLASLTLNIPLNKTIIIGDSIFDIQAGKNAGIKTAFCLWGFNRLEELAIKPDFVLSNFEQLIM